MTFSRAKNVPTILRLYLAPDGTQKLPFEQILAQLEDFWDSEAPRIGEPGAKGWASWAINQNADSTGPEPSNAIIPASTDSSSEAHVDDGYQKWAAGEAKLDANEWLSAHDDPEDPYSTILFSDIRPFLFPSSPSPSDLSLLLVLLQTLGLHVPGLSAFLVRHASPSHATLDADADTVWSHAPFASKPSHLGAMFSIPSETETRSASSARPSVTTGSAGTYDELIIGKERHMGSGWGPIKEWSLGTRQVLEGYGTNGEGRMWEDADLEGVSIPFIR